MTGRDDDLPRWVVETPGAPPCPYCGRLNRHSACASRPSDTIPDGSWMLCSACRRVAIFVAPTDLLPGMVRVLTDAEQAEADTDPDLRRARAALAESYDVAEALELLRPGATRE